VGGEDVDKTEGDQDGRRDDVSDDDEEREEAQVPVAIRDPGLPTKLEVMTHDLTLKVMVPSLCEG
jgi:hypothetical protein